MGAKSVGVLLSYAANTTFDNVLTGDVKARSIDLADSLTDVQDQNQDNLDKETCWSVCSYYDGDVCTVVSIVNSHAVGCKYAGFVVPGH